MTFLAFLIPMAPPISWVQPFQPTLELQQLGSQPEASPISTATAPFEKNAVHETSAEVWRHYYRAFELARKIDDFANPKNAAAEGSKPAIANRTALSAKALLEGLTFGYELPHVSHSEEGEVGFLWFRNGSRIEALLDCDNHLVWFWTAKDVMHPGGEQEFDGAFPDILLTMIDRR